MKRYKGVIFDLDGTVLNTVQDLSDSVNEVLRQLGCPQHSYEDYKMIIGHGFRNLVETSLPDSLRDPQTVEEALSSFLKIYDKRYCCKTAPYEGICALLKELRDRDIPIAVNSNKRDDYTKNLIQMNFPEVSFTEVIGERSGVPKKPDPASAWEIAEKMGLKPEEVLYVGDSGTDMITGKNAGMDAAGVLWGFRGSRELEKNGAAYLIRFPGEILELCR